MPRYFLNIRTGSGELIPDLEGDDLPDVAASRAEAFAVASELIAKSRDLDWSRCSFEVTNEQGETEYVLRFADAAQARSL